MTRVNVINPSELTNKHLVAELYEITRVFGLVRKAKARGINKYNIKEKLKVPEHYTMGTGHVLFFYTRLGYVADRYEGLVREAKLRNFKVNQIARESLLEGIDSFWIGGYAPTPEAIEINRQRIAERLK